MHQIVILQIIAYMEFKKRIGNRLKLARGKRTLAEIAGMTKNLNISRISNYEQGLRTPGPAEALELSRVLGNITAAEIMCVDEGLKLTKEESALLDNYRNSDDRGKLSIRRVAEAESGVGGGDIEKPASFHTTGGQAQA